MNGQVPNWVRYILPSLIIGATVALVLFALLGGGVRSRVLIIFLWPGLRLGELWGSGHDVHNWRESFVVVVSNGTVYGAIAFALMLILRKR